VSTETRELQSLEALGAVPELALADEQVAPVVADEDVGIALEVECLGVGAALVVGVQSGDDCLAPILLSIERVNVTASEGEPLANGADEAVDLAGDVRLAVARVFDRQDEIAVLGASSQRLKVKLLGRSEKTPASPSNGT
jgi:hypothetical protein